MNKRAALELSINAIVVIVIAMAVLGLGLGFVRTQLKTIGQTSLTVQEQAKQGILEDLRGAGGKRLSFPTERITMGPGEKKDLAIGIQNMEDSRMNFTIQLQWYNKSITPSPNFQNITSESGGVFYWDNTLQWLDARQTQVYGILYNTAGMTSGDYQYKIKLMTTIPGKEEYATKTFFVTVA